MSRIMMFARFILPAAKWGAIIGLVAGILYSFGGLIIDLFTIGLIAGLVFGTVVAGLYSILIKKARS